MSGRKFGRNGLSLPFGLDFDFHAIRVGEVSKEFVIPVNGPLNEIDREIAEQFTTFLEMMKDGPFYSGQISSRGSKGALNEEEQQGFSDGIKRYSDKYLKKRKISKSIEDFPYNYDFFPSELYSIMGSEGKMISLTHYNTNNKQIKKDAKSTNKIDDEVQAMNILEQIKNMVEEDDAIDINKVTRMNAEHEEDEEEDYDDGFEEDDDNDYNAEKYFDGGEEENDDGDDDEAAF
ncbi:DNA-directed RNA polymerase III subunit C31 ASCRUDRAFT_47984 [Ascoidea rubescens DSM 1968]|uniref:DNA-directed RNA polymerase III subunit n=1 Tax=Ascoidea rubescens DSM 1968 TaxID=1344418 RepID=A0A1D2VEP0_9ASCO|nr:hypothetical protein ASCRUDRAFT_47984 [Ascoidea rubescens DSM 1968]ODV60079.1 hypothetical protein ASCRUDRAFT_47984 [Ascoidea rubescens DSM 1968]